MGRALIYGVLGTIDGFLVMLFGFAAAGHVLQPGEVDDGAQRACIGALIAGAERALLGWNRRSKS
jgi:hypothetical protein